MQTTHSKCIVQVYEIQTPAEAEKAAACGVDHVGGVILSAAEWRDPILKAAVQVVQEAGLRSSLIPLFSDAATIMAALDYYRPDIVHFCERFKVGDNGPLDCENACHLQLTVKQRFPQIEIMRTIPIAAPGRGDVDAMSALVKRFESLSDIFLADTVLPAGSQPVAGFVGITGAVCDWETAAEMVRSTSLPVVLAGGISPNNVFDALMAVKPAGIDSCTATNAVDARQRPVRFNKDTVRLRRLVAEARRAEKELKGVR